MALRFLSLFLLTIAGLLLYSEFTSKSSKFIPYQCKKAETPETCFFLKTYKKAFHEFKSHKKNYLFLTDLKELSIDNQSETLVLKKIPLDIIKPYSNGKYKLDLLIHSWKEKNKMAYMLQYSFIELKSKNLVFENAQTIYVANVVTKNEK